MGDDDGDNDDDDSMSHVSKLMMPILIVFSFVNNQNQCCITEDTLNSLLEFFTMCTLVYITYTMNTY